MKERQPRHIGQDGLGAGEPREQQPFGGGVNKPELQPPRTGDQVPQPDRLGPSGLAAGPIADTQQAPIADVPPIRVQREQFYPSEEAIDEPHVCRAERALSSLPHQMLTSELAPRIAELLLKSPEDREVFFQQCKNWQEQRELLDMPLTELAEIVAISPRELQLIELGYPVPGPRMQNIARRMSGFLEAFHKLRGEDS